MLAVSNPIFKGDKKQLKDFLEAIDSIQSKELLISLKEKIKMQIIEPDLHWEKRMFLYRKVQFINSQILYLQTRMKKPS
jgi:CRISPR/Cas system-associated protein Cas5 (RAMP superfamily)